MRLIAWIVLGGLTLAACGTAISPRPRDEPLAPDERPSERLATERPAPQASLAASQGEEETSEVDSILINPRVEDFEAYLPPRLIGPDGIRPVYEPRFVAAPDAPLDDDELVIGIAIEGEAKAYPITVLRFREMVNDELAELPILVTW